MKKQPRLLVLLPILLCVLLSESNTKGRTFREANMENLAPEVCADISRCLVQQMVDADRQGLTEMELHVPKWESSDNWPHATVLMHRIAYPLHEHGILSRAIAVEPVPDPDINNLLP